MKNTFKYYDLILPILQQRGGIPDPCPIEIRVEEKRIRLQVGPRDWEFDRETGEMIGAGTCLCSSPAPGAQEESK